jgi:threonine dehydratase
MNTLRPTREQTIAAANLLAKHLRPTYLKAETNLSDYFGAEVYAKYEFQNPVRSFKIRGALTLVHDLVCKRIQPCHSDYRRPIRPGALHDPVF